jgi:DNA polymerase III subunit gamma/tau
VKQASLYRKWRPRAFSAIVGQEPVVRTLRRAIEKGRVAHAYLFSGPRGTGKTSTAKVLAMGLNCEQGPTAEPDGTCAACRGVINNSSLDVVEMDAASNRGIDEIRDLRDRVNLAPVSGRMKVYIIDEVHMLTTEAFNALLKMLEEPPEHVVFVLATTEKHKVLPTIVSRCQSFEFRRPGVDVLSGKLAEIAAAEGIEVEAGALNVISREARGSFRDAEGLLDQLSSFAEDGITAQSVRDLLGSVGPEALLDTTAALHERRATDALRIVDRLSNEGRDLGQFVTELVAHLRVLMLLPHAPEVALAEVGADERGPLEEQAAAIPTVEVVRLVEALGATLGRIKRGGEPKIEVELAFLKLARDYTEPPVDALLRRLETLERAVESGVATRALSAAPPTLVSPEEPAPPEAEPSTVGSSETGAETTPEPHDRRTQAPALRWGEVMAALKGRRKALTAAVYGDARVEEFDGEVLAISFPEDKQFQVGMAQERKHVDELQNVLEGLVGGRPRLEVRAGGGAAGGAASGAEVESSTPRAPEALTPRPAPEEVPPADEPPEFAPPEELRTDARGADPGVYSGTNGSSDGSLAEGLSGDDATIHDEREVFRLAQERLGFGGGGGS